VKTTTLDGYKTFSPNTVIPLHEALHTRCSLNPCN